MSLDWQDDALCAQTDPDLFFPEKGDHGGVKNARKVCASCPVQAQCAAFALAAWHEHGIWGGMTPKERKQIRRSRVSA